MSLASPYFYHGQGNVGDTSGDIYIAKGRKLGLCVIKYTMRVIFKQGATTKSKELQLLTGSNFNLSPNSNVLPDKSRTSAPISKR